MTRCVALVMLALTLNATSVHAQNNIFTITVRSANVHKGPALSSPVIGHAAQTTVLTVLRNLGSWAEVRWPYSRNGLGYVHVTTGRLGPGANRASAAGSPRLPSPRPAVPQTAGAPAPARTTPASPSTSQRTAPRDAIPSAPLGQSRVTHIVGVGGMVGSTRSWGATARWWRDTHLGLQAALTRDAIAGDAVPGRVTSTQIEPGVVYAFIDRVTGSVSFRPYVGSGLSFRRQTLKDGLAELVSDTGVGWRVFGGTELTFAGAPRFGLSAELGYRRQPAPFAGFEPDRFGVAVAGHWYIK